MFSWVDTRDNRFKKGENIEQIMVEFSDAEENGFKDALGCNFVQKGIRGWLSGGWPKFSFCDSCHHLP